MLNAKTNKMAQKAIGFILILLAFTIGLLFSGEYMVLWALIGIICIVYYFILIQINLNTYDSSILCDGRFYVFTSILAYSVLPPIYGLLTYGQNQGIRMRSTYTASTYTLVELRTTLIMSIFFFVGLLIGVFVRQHSKYNIRSSNIVTDDDDTVSRKLFFCWLIVCAISTIGFLVPFFQGGFRAILAGGTIADVETAHENTLLWKIMDVFFSSEMMTASTVAVLYYGYNININNRKKKLLLVSVVIIEALLAYLTTRRARAVAIIMCAMIIYIHWYKKEKGKLPIGRIIVISAIFVFIYSLEFIMGLAHIKLSYVGYLQLFDGIPVYDSLLLSTRSTPSLSMLSNIVYGIFRPIPILGKYFIQLIGFKNDVAPMYQWMADRYVTYQYGGGLAYTPQLEAYLTGGMIGCLLFGNIYGFVFGKKRNALPNLFIAAMAFSIARGNLQIVLSLMWPFGIIGYYLYDRFLFRRIRISIGKPK